MNISGATPMHYVVRSEYSEDLIEVCPTSSLIDTCQRPQVLHLMMENHANLDTKSKSGETPLMNAISKKMTEIVRFLIDYGANVNVKTR